MSNYNRESVDAAADREGMAELWMAANGLTAYPVARHVVLAMHAQEAAERGLPAPQMNRYCWQASCEAHRKIPTMSPSLLVWGKPEWRNLRHRETPQRKARRTLKKARRALLLERLANAPGRKVVTLPVAVELTGIAHRTLCRAAATGRLPAIRDYQPIATNGFGTGRFKVRVKDLRNLLANKVAGRPVAA